MFAKAQEFRSATLFQNPFSELLFKSCVYGVLYYSWKFSNIKLLHHFDLFYNRKRYLSSFQGPTAKT